MPKRGKRGRPITEERLVVHPVYNVNGRLSNDALCACQRCLVKNQHECTVESESEEAGSSFSDILLVLDLPATLGRTNLAKCWCDNCPNHPKRKNESSKKKFCRCEEYCDAVWLRENTTYLSNSLLSIRHVNGDDENGTLRVTTIARYPEMIQWKACACSGRDIGSGRDRCLGVLTILKGERHKDTLQRGPLMRFELKWRSELASPTTSDWISSTTKKDSVTKQPPKWRQQFPKGHRKLSMLSPEDEEEEEEQDPIEPLWSQESDPGPLARRSLFSRAENDDDDDLDAWTTIASASKKKHQSQERNGASKQRTEDEALPHEHSFLDNITGSGGSTHASMPKAKFVTPDHENHHLRGPVTTTDPPFQAYSPVRRLGFERVDNRAGRKLDSDSSQGAESSGKVDRETLPSAASAATTIRHYTQADDNDDDWLLPPSRPGASDDAKESPLAKRRRILGIGDDIASKELSDGVECKAFMRRQIQETLCSGATIFSMPQDRAGSSAENEESSSSPPGYALSLGLLDSTQHPVPDGQHQMRDDFDSDAGTNAEDKRRRPRFCKDLTLQDWGKVRDESRPGSFRRAMCDLVLTNNKGREPASQKDLWLPSMIEDDCELQGFVLR